MATIVSSQFSICICVILMVHGSMAQLFYPSTNPWHSPHQGSFSEYRFDGPRAFESLQKVRSEGDVTEYVDERNELLQHTGTFVIRRVIQPQGFLVPRYTNSLRMVYIVQGRGSMGLTFPGCPATYQDQYQQFSPQWQSESQKFRDEHQKIYQFRQGDIVALPAGVAHWFYNDGDAPLVAVYVYDINNNANQLEPRQKEFLLADNNNRVQQVYGSSTEQHPGQNIFNRFGVEQLGEALGINTVATKRLQGQNDQRGEIIVDGLYPTAVFKGRRVRLIPRYTREWNKRAGDKDFYTGSDPQDLPEDMVQSRTKKVVIDKPSMARDIPTSLCDLPQAVRDGIVNEAAATKDAAETEIGSATTEKVANMASQPASSGTVRAKKRKWGFGAGPMGGVLTKGTHSSTSSPDNAPTSGRLKPMRFMSKSKAKAAPTISDQNMGKHDEASSHPATPIIVSHSSGPLPSAAAVVVPPPGTAFDHLASACQEVLLSAKVASTEVNQLVTELTATKAKVGKLKEELAAVKTDNESLRLLIKENSEIYQECQKALAEEKNKREALSAGLKENFFAFNEVAKQLGRGLKLPLHPDDVSLLASIHELVGEMEKVPADIAEKADWDTRIALKTGACHTLACISSKHPELDLNKEVHEGVAEEEREKLMDQLEKTGEAVANFYLD